MLLRKYITSIWWHFLQTFAQMLEQPKQVGDSGRLVSLCRWFWVGKRVANRLIGRVDSQTILEPGSIDELAESPFHLGLYRVIVLRTDFDQADVSETTAPGNREPYDDEARGV